MTPRIIFCGSRDWTDREMIRAAVRRCVEDHGPFELIHGGARGADSIAAGIGVMLGLPVRAELADWVGRGRGAGPERNRRMLDLGPVLVVAFKDGFNFSLRCGGTENMAKIAAKAGVPVHIYSHEWSGPAEEIGSMIRGASTRSGALLDPR